jgi:hypothetical protein
MKKCRLYIDESGTHNYSISDKVDKRYLGLVGVAISDIEYTTVLQPKMRDIKLMFGGDPDEPPILHREDIIKKSGLFTKLNDKDFETDFNQKIFDIVSNTKYIICCVVLDKKSHFEKYSSAAYHPYHYCLNILLERYSWLLEEYDFHGDVMAESRGKREDNELRSAYNTFYTRGTYFRSKESIQQRITSKSLKTKPKTANIVGLEFADLLSLATKLDTLHFYGAIPELTENFCKQIVSRIEPKYRRDPASHKVGGFGKKLIK